MEWSPERIYNPMNSMAKGLTYYQNYLNILRWMEGKNELGPPIEASLDPSSACNNACYYCSSNRYLEDRTAKRWGMDYFEEILCHLVQWGIKGLCWGGREATLNPRLAEANRMAKTLGIETAIVTNGVNLSNDLIDALMLCKWIGVSVDTTDPEVYRAVRGTNDCQKVWLNIAKIARKKAQTVLGVRALVLPETIETLYDTCKRAREIGANFCHIRPADLERKDLDIAQKINFNMEKIRDIFERCHELETSDFGVFTITHKYDENFHVKHDFKRCWASPLVVQICTNKKMYVCVDHRLEPRFEVKKWGSDEHRQLLQSIDPATECSRCTWSSYQRQIEEVVLEDRMHRNFP